MRALLLAALVTCFGIDDTAAIQTAINIESIQLRGACLVNGRVGVQIPSDRTIEASSASVRITPTCNPGQVCRIFETVPGARNVHYVGGEMHGNPAVAPGWQVLWRFDSARDSSISGVTFKLYWKALSDAVYAGGNAPSTNIVISDISVDGAGRNAISITHADGIYVQHSLCTNGALGVSPGACVDIESGIGERVTRYTVMDVTSMDHEVGIYVHKKAESQMGLDGVIARSRFVRSRKAATIINSHKQVAYVDNVVEGAPIGLSIGSHTEAERAVDILAWGNVINADRAVLLAGCMDSRVIGNDLSGGRVETVALGSAGRMQIEAPYAAEACH